jgi:hypothetical protein
MTAEREEIDAEENATDEQVGDATITYCLYYVIRLVVLEE